MSYNLMAFKRVSRIAAAVFVLFQSTAAYAFERTGNEIADAFLSVLDAQQGNVEKYEKIETTDELVTIQNILLLDKGTGQDKVTIGNAILTNGSLTPKGRLALPSLKLHNINLSGSDGGASLDLLEVENLLLPSPSEVAQGKQPDGPGYKTLRVSKLNYFSQNEQIASIEKIRSSFENTEYGLPRSAELEITGISVASSQLGVTEFQALSELGYEKLHLDVVGTASWNELESNLVIPKLEIDLKDAGTLTFSGIFGGVTKETLVLLNDSTAPSGNLETQILNITLENISLKFSDNSLTQKIIGQEASRAGLDTQEFVSRLNTSLPILLSMLQDKPLEQHVAKTLGQFLGNPATLELIASPASPVPLSQVIGTIGLAPNLVPQLLSLDLTYEAQE